MILLALVFGSAWADEDSGIAWDKRIDNAKARFKVLNEFDGQAVLDKETGLVWERSPDATTGSWFTAVIFCATRQVGGRKGWHLPMREQLASLLDPNNPGGNPDLPPGHPFSNVQSGTYWSATTSTEDPSVAWTVVFSNGAVASTGKANTVIFAWCVRGGQTFDGNTHSTLH